MHPKNRALPLALALASGAAAAGLAQFYLATMQPAEAADAGRMVVAAHRLTDGQPLTAADLTSVPTRERPTGAFDAPDALIGRLPLVAIPAGQPLLTSHLAAPGTQPGLLYHIAPGKRAVAVAVDEVAGVGGFLKPGLQVDVIGVTQADGRWNARTLAQLVPVLAVAQEDRATRGDVAAQIVRSATLLVTPAQAEALSLAGEQGRIRLVLRAPGDTTIVKTKPLPAYRPPAPKVVIQPVPAPAPVVRYAPPPPPARPAPQPAGIVVMHGSNTEVVAP